MLIAVLFAGMLSDAIGHRKVILSGISLWVIGLVIFNTTSSASLALAIWLLTGIGFGTTDSGLNSLIASTSKNKGSDLNQLHFWFGVGALCGPLLAGLMITYFNWRLLFTVTIGIMVLYLIYMYSQNYPKVARSRVSPWKSLSSIALQPEMLLLGVIMFCYTGTGTAYIGWINTHLTRTHHLSNFYASLVLTLYSAGLAVGRLFVVFISRRLTYAKILLGGAFLSCFSASLAVFSHNPIIIGIGFALTGVFFATLLPTSLALGTKLFPEYTGTVTGLLIFFGALGRTFLPGLVGVIADNSGTAIGLQVLLVAIALMTLSAFRLTKLQLEDDEEM